MSNNAQPSEQSLKLIKRWRWAALGVAALLAAMGALGLAIAEQNIRPSNVATVVDSFVFFLVFNGIISLLPISWCLWLGGKILAPRFRHEPTMLKIMLAFVIFGTLIPYVYIWTIMAILPMMEINPDFWSQIGEGYVIIAFGCPIAMVLMALIFGLVGSVICALFVEPVSRS